MKATRILETCLYAENLQETATFYRQVLGLEPFSEVKGRHVFFRSQGGVFLLFNPHRTRVPEGEWPVPGHGPTGAGHVAFVLDSAELAAWRDHLTQHQVDIEQEVTWPNGAKSIYFRDPAGNSIELAEASLWASQVLPG